MSFEKSMETLLTHEGGYSNDPKDHGGETFRGIARRWFPKWEGWRIIDKHTNKEALINDPEVTSLVYEFYKKYFWDRLHASEIESEFTADLLFNLSVNIGKRTVIKKAQRVAGVKADGIIGPVTIAAINNTDTDKFVYHFLLEVIELYVQLGKTQPHYLRGWMNRAISLYYSYEQYKVSAK